MAAHRLRLTAAEWAFLLGLSGAAPPPGFEAAAPAETGSLAERGVLSSGGEVVPSIVANLAVLSGLIGIGVRVAVGALGLRAHLAVAGELGASAFALADGAVELSLFPVVELAGELARAVPVLGAGGGRLRDALGGGVRLAGQVPLEALSEFDEARRVAGEHGGASVVAALGLDEGEAELVAAASERTLGTLRAIVTGPVPGGVAVGQVIWLATDAGWVGLRPGEHRMVTFEPAGPSDLGAWLAPHLSELLEAAA